MDADRTVVVKSTVPVGTCLKVVSQFRSALDSRGRSDLTVRVASNPEFLG